MGGRVGGWTENAILSSMLTTLHIRQPAKEYTQYLLEWVLEQLESEEIFPVFWWPYEDEKERPSYGGVDALGVSFV